MDAIQRKRMGTVALCIAAAGVITLVIAIWQASRQMVVLKTWTPVQAQLVKTSVENQKILSSIETARADNYLVTWTFRYDVGGRTHVATTDPGSHGNYSQMLRWSQRFDPGQNVMIHYQPDDPDVISAAQWDWTTFYRSAWVAAWGIGIIALGLIMRFFASRVSTPAYRAGR